jgi:hypothetical protein
MVKQHLNSSDRPTFKHAASQQAMELLRRAILRKG